MPMVRDEFSIEQCGVRVYKRQQYLARPRTLKRPNSFDPRFSYTPFPSAPANSISTSIASSQRLAPSAATTPLSS